ncbi:unnamed protein product [Sphagnum balticum]
MHKARVKLMRVPLEPLSSNGDHDGPLLLSIEASHISGEGKQNEYAYRLEIIEDLDDGRAHSYEEGEAPPSLYGDVALAGIREFLPVRQISKIFYVAMRSQMEKTAVQYTTYRRQHFMTRLLLREDGWSLEVEVLEDSDGFDDFGFIIS